MAELAYAPSPRRNTLRENHVNKQLKDSLGRIPSHFIYAVVSKS